MSETATLVPAPFASSLMAIEPAWIDYNGHLNVAYYNVLFDRAIDEFYLPLGLGPDYLKATHHSTMVVESHVRYLREVHVNAPLRITTQLVGFDAKRFHVYQEMLHAEEGWLSATCETMTVHVDMTAKKVAPFPEAVMAAFARMQAVHAALPVPAAVGRRIAMPGPKAAAK
ncbi:MAG: thioesterase family protein [Proteobacteria bacterium]|nr:thioesterase family protein [Pseudomonadota bacterium]